MALPVNAHDGGGATSSRHFRSEPMSLVQLYIPADIAQATVNELGELGAVQFRDLNPDVSAFQRAYVAEIRRLDEMERRLRFLWQQAEKANLTIPTTVRGPPVNYARKQQELDELEVLLAEMEARIVQMNSSQTTFQKKFLELTEMRHVLKETAVFLDESAAAGGVGGSAAELGPGPVDDAPLLDHDIEAAGAAAGPASTTIQIGFVAGVIERKKLMAFERILWRALRGNLLLKSADIDTPITDPETDEQVVKTVFCIFAHGRETLDKIKRLSESLGATLYPVDPNSAKRHEDAREVAARLDDLNQVLFNTATTKRHELSKLADAMCGWRILIAKEKAVFHTMNLFGTTDATARKTLIAEGWCPTEAIPRVQHALNVAKEATRGMVPSILHVVPTTRAPPTFHKTNKLTEGFQEIIDAYGMARYQEVNPGLFTVITFPFLFAVMFGDFGHGLLVTLVGIYLCVKEDALRIPAKKSEYLGTLYGGRYIILLMGLFAMYTGLIYNDTLSKSMSLFKSGWTWEEGKAEATPTGTYPFGVDWAWQLAENRLLFSNSYKMKMSIIFGVIHMSFATFLSLFNHLHFKKRINIFCEFIPQVLFMQCIFGYLVVCMIAKWLINWQAVKTHGPPGLLNMLIFMFLSPGNVKPEDELYSGQGTVQLVLVLVAVLCVPWMLCIKPYLLKKEHDRTVAQGYGVLPAPVTAATPAVMSENPDSPTAPVPAASAAAAGAHGDGGHGDEHGEHFEFGEIVIHQVIHTIEYCLGCISNTASYLRLWALSLAHAQLSEVLWDMTLASALSSESSIQFIVLVIIFPLWFAGTVGILLGMEGLSAFLHALRLHWVEFNNKFYEGSGYKFEPFALREVGVVY